MAGCTGDEGETDQLTTSQTTTATPTTETNTPESQTTTTETSEESGYDFRKNEDGWYMTPEGDCESCNLPIISDKSKYDDLRSNLNDWMGKQVFIENVTVSPSQVDGYYVLNEFGGERGYLTKTITAEPDDELGLVAMITGSETVQDMTIVTIDVIAQTVAVPDAKDTPSE